jgi:malate synthase
MPVTITRAVEGMDRVLTPQVLILVEELARAFQPARDRLLAERAARQVRLDLGERPALRADTAAIRSATWQVAPPPPALADRRVEITGPAERKMMINALNSGATGFMADMEDALSPTWDNVVRGHANLIDAGQGTLDYTGPDGRAYLLNDKVATLLVRPRGWHLDEPHVRVNDIPVSASLFDFAVAFAHGARYFYLPKLEGHLEARLWREVIGAAERTMGVQAGTVRVTVLIETILAAFEMDEILFELRDYGAALNAGRWDYIFSIIKKFRLDPAFVLPDRAQITMTTPFMRAYAERLVRTCHHRGAQAIGGMAAFIPSRRDPVVNEAAMRRVREDKTREAAGGFDGTWVAHPDLVPVALEAFGARGERSPAGPPPGDDTAALLDVRIPGGAITAAGVLANVRVALLYLDAWLHGSGAVGIDNLMEDTATAEIARAQLWQWIRHRSTMADGSAVTPDVYMAARAEVLAGAPPGPATGMLDQLVLGDVFIDFLTLPGIRILE